MVRRLSRFVGVLGRVKGALRRWWYVRVTDGPLRRLFYQRQSLLWHPVERLSSDNPDAIRWLSPQLIRPALRDTLYCHPPAELTYRVDVRRGDRLLVGCALMPTVWNRQLGGVEFSITVQSPDGTPLRRRECLVDPGHRPEDRQWRFLRVPLGAGGQPLVDIILRTQVPEWFAGENAWAIWGDPRVERRRSFGEVAALLRLLMRRLPQVGGTRALRELGLAGRSEAAEYRQWASINAARDADPPQHATAAPLASQPLISILTPVYNTPPDVLRACAASVLRQTYTHWEWCLSDDASNDAGTAAALAELTDPRIRTVRLDRRSGIAAASQAALASASGEFVALLDHDDELVADALWQVARVLNDEPPADIVYSDEDKIDHDEGLSDPFFKPDWSPEHLPSTMFTCHLTVARRSIVERAGGFAAGVDGAQDHDLMLRMMALTDRIRHVPRVLYHWRRVAGSVAVRPDEKPWADQAGQRAVTAYLTRNGLGAVAESGGVPGLYRPRFTVRDSPRTLIVVCGENADAGDACLARVRESTEGAPYEIVQARRCAAAVNAAVAASAAEQVVLLDAALDVRGPGWLTALLEYAQQPAIGAVGGRISYPDGRFRHIGIVVGVGRGVDRPLHAHLKTPGYFTSAIGVRNYSAVSAECLMTSRALFQELGGLDEALPWSVADVDYCLKARRAGRRVVFTPYADAQIRAGVEPAPLPDADAISALRARWGETLERDPYYNPNFDKARADYSLEQM